MGWEKETIDEVDYYKKVQGIDTLQLGLVLMLVAAVILSAVFLIHINPAGTTINL